VGPAIVLMAGVGLAMFGFTGGPLQNFAKTIVEHWVESPNRAQVAKVGANAYREASQRITEGIYETDVEASQDVLDAIYKANGGSLGGGWDMATRHLAVAIAERVREGLGPDDEPTSANFARAFLETAEGLEQVQ